MTALEYKQLIEKELDGAFVKAGGGPLAGLAEAMRYSLLAGGKRIRPMLVLEFCRISGGSVEQALPVASAVEMLHTYSLIHDDLPCMDDDDVRRGKPTNHKVYGEAIAVLAGDALLTAAFSYLAKADLSAEARIRAVEILSQCAGELGMVGGQVLDIEGEQKVCTAQQVLDIETRKTGALICAACMLGVIAADGNAVQLKAAETFASNLGLAFQIRDDMLDVIGDQQALGKAVGTDQDKNTFVQLYGLETCEHLVREHTQKAIAALDAFQENGYLIDLAHSLIDRTV